MRFKIVSVGWHCEEFMERTFRSIEQQSVDNWDVWIIYDGGDNGAETIRTWCDERDERWNYTINETQQFAVRNQVEAIQRLAPEDNDIVVWLDLDGDMFAHPDVLANLTNYYTDGTLMTYGSYTPVPWVSTSQPACPFPPEVIQSSSYRHHILTVHCCFNHLRTMKGSVANAIPLDQFRWPDGRWYEGGTDYIFMVAGLELTNGRHKFIPEVLLLYNHANPRADYLVRSPQSDACTQNYLRRPPLSEMEM